MAMIIPVMPECEKCHNTTEFLWALVDANNDLHMCKTCATKELELFNMAQRKGS